LGKISGSEGDQYRDYGLFRIENHVGRYLFTILYGVTLQQKEV